MSHSTAQHAPLLLLLTGQPRQLCSSSKCCRSSSSSKCCRSSSSVTYCSNRSLYSRCSRVSMLLLPPLLRPQQAAFQQQGRQRRQQQCLCLTLAAALSFSQSALCQTPRASHYDRPHSAAAGTLPAARVMLAAPAAVTAAAAAAVLTEVSPALPVTAVLLKGRPGQVRSL